MLARVLRAKRLLRYTRHVAALSRSWSPSAALPACSMPCAALHGQRCGKHAMQSEAGNNRLLSRDAQQVPAMVARLLHLATHELVYVKPFSAHTAAAAPAGPTAAQRASQPEPMLRWNRSAVASQSPTAKGSAPWHDAQQALRYVPPAPHTGAYAEGHRCRQASMRAVPATVDIAGAGAPTMAAAAPSRNRRCSGYGLLSDAVACAARACACAAAHTSAASSSSGRMPAGSGCRLFGDERQREGVCTTDDERCVVHIASMAGATRESTL